MGNLGESSFAGGIGMSSCMSSSSDGGKGKVEREGEMGGETGRESTEEFKFVES